MFKEMETKIENLKLVRDEKLIKLNKEKDNLVSIFVNIIEPFVKPFGFNVSAYVSYMFESSISFNMGIPKDGGGSMFHSTFSACYLINKGILEINCGTSGNYNIEENEDQVKRAFAIAEIWKNIYKIQENMRNVDISNYRKANLDYLNADRDVVSNERNLEALKYEEAKSNVAVGSEFKYTEKMDAFYNLFRYMYDVEEIIKLTVVKVCPKNIDVLVETKRFGKNVKQIYKSALIDAISSGRVERI